MSVDYYTRIEQGRESTPSDAVLDAPARALRLGDDEYEHLLALADRAVGRTPRRRAARPRPAPTGLLTLLEAVRPAPTFVLNQVNDALAANPEGLALFCGCSDWPPMRRNTIRYAFGHPAARELFPEWERVARNSVARLHSVVPLDPAGVAALADELCAAATEFAALWARHEVWVKRGGETMFRHPVLGTVTLGNEVLTHADGHRVLLYQARPGSPAADTPTLAAMLAVE